MKKKKPFGWRGLLFLFLLAAVVLFGYWQREVVFAAGDNPLTEKGQYRSVNDELLECYIKIIMLSAQTALILFPSA